MAGQITQRSKGSYQIRVENGRDANGKRKIINTTVRGNKKQAQAVLNKILREQDMGVLVEPTKVSVNGYLDKWLEAAAKGRLRPRTYAEYEKQLKRYIRPTLGDAKLHKLTPAGVQKVYSDMLGRGLSARTVRLTHAIFSNALKQAVKWDMLPRNVCEAVDLPKQQKKEMQALSKDEANRFKKAAKGDRWYPLLVVLLETGMRPSEALGLKWSDVDLAESRLTINRKVTRVNGGWLEEPPKTQQSRRTIDLLASTRTLLAGLERDGELVFTDEEGGYVRLRSVYSNHFKPILEKAGIGPDVRLYDLRHTHATHLLLAGVHAKIVSERLGHSSIQITLDTYSHVLPGMQKDALAKLEALYEEDGGKGEAEPLYN